MIHRYCIIVIHVFLLTSLALKCYEGSRGVVNGEDATNFVENQCDENMTFCFESYNTNLTEVTASCQSMGTDQKLLEVCKMDNKCRERSDIDVTVCCCTSDLCNLQDDLKPTPEPGTPLDNSTSSTTESSEDQKMIRPKNLELNETMMEIGLESNDTLLFN